MKLIALITDFGLKDWFVGTMKGVIQKIAPDTSVIDLTHGIPAGDIRAGAFALAAASQYFPSGTIYVGVVDPGVGGERAGLIIETENGYFIGPDNGLFSYALRGERLKSIRKIQNPRFQLANVSQTFHGRDVFAPVAAHISRGVPLSQFGTRVHDFEQLDWPEIKITATGLRGQVVYIDHFGNAITNVTGSSVLNSGAQKIRVGQKLVPIEPSYAAVKAGKPVAVIGSSGLLEIAINSGNAAKSLKLKIGSSVLLSAKRY